MSFLGITYNTVLFEYSLINTDCIKKENVICRICSLYTYYCLFCTSSYVCKSYIPESSSTVCSHLRFRASEFGRLEIVLVDSGWQRYPLAIVVQFKKEKLGNIPAIIFRIPMKVECWCVSENEECHGIPQFMSYPNSGQV